MNQKISRAYAHAMKNARISGGMPDLQDVKQIADEFHGNGRLRQLAERAAAESAIASVGGRAGVNYRGMGRDQGKAGYGTMGGNGNSCARDYTPTHGSDGRVNTEDQGYKERGVPSFRGLADCDEAPYCGGDILGFNTLEAANFPLAGPVAPAVAAGAAINISSETADVYQPRALFFEFRDVEQGFAVIPGLLQDARIGPAQQTIGGAVGNGITSAVFALTNTPLPVGWDAFRNVGGQTLQLTFANFLVGTNAQVFGVLWGDAK